MYLVVAQGGWQCEEGEAARIIATALGTVAFEARQKIAGGGPAVLANFADQNQAQALSEQLSQSGILALMIDTQEVRSQHPPLQVCRFGMGEQALRVEAVTGGSCEINYAAIELLLVASCSAGQVQTTSTVTKRKFSLGKTLLAGGVPMTKKVSCEQVQISQERDETLWLYAREKTLIFNRAQMQYTGFGNAMKLSRDLNFTHLKNELRRLAPQARYDERMLKRAGLIRLLGPTLSPETDLDLAFEILSRSLRPKPTSASES